MTTSNSQATRVAADPSDSMLMGLARAALAHSSSVDMSWPALDLSDARQREFGDYELLEEIGRGGMGVVYRARQRSLDRDVAIKFISAGLADSINVARFLAEARAAARLMHPNIVPVHEVGSIEHVHFFSMPLIQGVTLAKRLDEASMPLPAVLAMMSKVCEAIDYAHRLGLLHLDLKPANVLLDARNEPLIADFGLARHMDTSGGVDAQEVSGTPAFMAPEQILIKQYRLTPATDIYALGAILYRCLTGVSPHGEGNSDDLIRRAAAGRIRNPRELDPTISRDLAAICMKCMELQPSDRYISVAKLADDLRHVRDGLPVSVRPVGRFERLQRWFRREPKLASSLAVAVSALIIGASATTWQWREALAQRDVATAERDRATIASELGAHLYAYGNGPVRVGSNDSDNQEDRARSLITWLHKRLPGDEERQADALTAFATSVSTESRTDAEMLLFTIIGVLGVDYRQQMIKALQSSSDSSRHMYAAMLGWADTGDPLYGDAASANFADSMQAAVEVSPDDPFVWHMAAVYCPQKDREAHCQFPHAAETLVKMAPENMYHWLLVTMTTKDSDRARAAIHEAAKRSQLDDYIGVSFSAYARAIKVAAVPLPSLIARPVMVLAPDENPETSIALLEATRSLALPNWSALMRHCGAAIGTKIAAHTQLRADCVTVGERLARSQGGILSQMIGVAMVRNLAEGTPLAEEMKQIRRLYQYLQAMDKTLSPRQQMTYSASRFLSDLTSAGEMLAFQRRIEFFGLPGKPPADWQPEDPNELLSARERIEKLIASNLEGHALVAQGKHAEAIEVLVPIEAATRKYLNDRNAWRVPRFLVNLGRARVGVRQFPAAKENLQEAWNIVKGYGPTSAEARDCAQALIALYTAWSTAEPSKGHDIKAAEWQVIADELEAARSG